MAEPVGHMFHDCRTPSNPTGLRRRHWTCEFCRRTWQPEGKGAWSTSDKGGVPVAVTFRYPDGSTATFGEHP